VIFESANGFEIAERDLELRGPGEYLGERQSGEPLLRFADLKRDAELVAQATEAALEMLAHHPAAARAHVERWLGGRKDLLQA
jgi:ATP-dependent DNA helicase RecG